MELMKNLQNVSDAVKKNMSTNSRVMQALENLTESQVNDFLTGRAPLLLAMKLGEHMMFVQLQLSSSSCSSRRRSQPHPPVSPSPVNSAPNPAHYSQPNSSSNERSPSSRCACTPPPASSPSAPNLNSGAVIDSVNHLGQGVYSGTFSGTLDPSIQDPTGRPKRDINTILQILNDLLIASPQLQDTSSNSQKSYAQQTMPASSILHQSQGPEYSADGERLRGKVQTLQKMMQERKLRRQEKRGLRAPYQWPNRSSHSQHSSRAATRVNYESPLAREREMSGKAESHTEAAFTPTSALEHESVLV